MGKGLLIVISGPSGAGKGTVCKHLISNTENVVESISVTTRKPRHMETDGVNYFFKSKDEFEEMIHKNQLIEYAHVFDNYYGTPKQYVLDTLKSGKDVVLEIEILGARQVREMYKDAIFVFIVPPSIIELEHRLRGRGTESEGKIKKRLARSIKELTASNAYDYVVVNDDVDIAAEQIKDIISVERLAVKRNSILINKMLKEAEKL